MAKSTSRSELASSSRECVSPRPSRSDRLIEILRRPDLPYSIIAEWVASEMHNSEGNQPGKPKPWRDLSRSTMTSQKVRNTMVELGWAYRPQMGGKGPRLLPRVSLETRPCWSEATASASVACSS
jgi:hypothetical protein